MRRLARLPRVIHGTFVRAMQHDCLNLAQSTAYSAMVSLFPMLIVAAAVVSLLPDTAPLRFQLSSFFDRILPPDVSPLLESYFVTSAHTVRSNHALSLSALVSLLGASSVIATLMEGVRRANDLPADCWTFLQRRRRALLLVPLSLIPFALASLLVVFGHFITLWLALHVMVSARTPVYLFALLVRWVVALAGSIGITAVIYHMGTPMQQSWKRTLPGAVASTFMWFIATLVFGWYVTRFANYSQVYGSLGAGIALLFWLYIISLSVLWGAEFNSEFHARFFSHHSEHLPPNNSAHS
ncbi:YihY/virulence factor BrkB family protein [Granulicella sp. L60]|jgi:membrane protein|uniref:YihY/virulence factor BrkB family protein n=1 Tax=Granulicella sp. L60 TaxID=1641866 RepID=UPI00131CB3AB|nr:YihY/virulence factor BrkB family protein [Granulicella sp. L60]